MGLFSTATRFALKTASIAALALVTSCNATPDPIELEGDLLLVNASLIDPRNEEIRQTHLVITDGVIITELTEQPDIFTGETIDLDGRYIIPGLIDMHTHSYGNRAPGRTMDAPGTEAIANRVLYAGVTGLVDLFNDEQTMIDARLSQQNGETGGADIFSSLSCLTATEGHCTEYGVPTRTMNTPQEARDVVNDLATHAPDVIKIVYQPSDDQPSIDIATFAAAVETANAHNISTIVHMKTWQDIRDAIEVGATAITHIPSGDIPADIPGLMADAGLVIIPTMAVQIELTNFVFDSEVLDAPMARAMTTTDLINSYRSEVVITNWGDREERWRASDVQNLASIRAMNEAGVTILAGTDAGNYGTIHGYSMHREMIQLVNAGLTNWQALAAATTGASDFLGHAGGFEIGAPASFVILGASPIEDISNTQTIEMVIHHGEVVDREALVVGE